MRSMTGCGRGQCARNGWACEVELKSVNHRFLDLAIRLPRALSFLEEPLRRGISAELKRGHVEVFVTARAEQGGSEVTVDEGAVNAYLQAALRLAGKPGVESGLRAAEILSLPGVVSVAEAAPDEETVTACCGEALAEALRGLTGMRAREGLSLQADLAAHLDAAAACRDAIEELAPGVVTASRERLIARLRQMQVENADPARIAQETALIADRCAIDEELARLVSHIGQMRAYLQAEGEVGKKMDFLIQEMNREVNTIGSKCGSAAIAQLVVDMKSEIEKLREQVQNVE